jgi:lipopolysaccharide transport system permease protein
MNNGDKTPWTTIITPKKGWFELNLKEIWAYRDLISIFVRRDIVAIYKQTILGPVWFLLGPLFTVFSYTFLFSEVAHLSTDGLPGPLFYLAGTTLWGYFQTCFNGASYTFQSNAGIFGKVYFPRLVSPISMIISNLLKFSLQLLVFILFLVYYLIQKDSVVVVNKFVFLVPFVILLLGLMALGSGIIVSTFTTKYRDLSMLIGVFLTVLMYASPIMYPVSAIPDLYKPFLAWNPISPLIEVFRYGFTSRGVVSWSGLLYSSIFTITILLLGVVLFNRTEKTFMDTV